MWLSQPPALCQGHMVQVLEEAFAGESRALAGGVDHVNTDALPTPVSWVRLVSLGLGEESSIFWGEQTKCEGPENVMVGGLTDVGFSAESSE